MIIRQAKKNDCYDLWIWRNNPEVRKWCFDTNKIDYEVHRKWFRSRDKNTRIYIAEDEKGKKIGQVRFEINQLKIAYVNVNLNPEYFGKGIGGKIIEKATEYFMMQEKDIKEIAAEIKDDNIASKKAFKKAHYIFSRSIFINKNKVAVFIYKSKICNECGKELTDMELRCKPLKGVYLCFRCRFTYVYGEEKQEPETKPVDVNEYLF